jgi:hypothetical protein
MMLIYLLSYFPSTFLLDLGYFPPIYFGALIYLSSLIDFTKIIELLSSKNSSRNLLFPY